MKFNVTQFDGTPVDAGAFSDKKKGVDPKTNGRPPKEGSGKNMPKASGKVKGGGKGPKGKAPPPMEGHEGGLGHSKGAVATGGQNLRPAAVAHKGHKGEATLKGGSKKASHPGGSEGITIGKFDASNDSPLLPSSSLLEDKKKKSVKGGGDVAKKGVPKEDMSPEPKANKFSGKGFGVKGSGKGEKLGKIKKVSKTNADSGN